MKRETKRKVVVAGTRLAIFVGAAFIWINYLPSPTRLYPAMGLHEEVFVLNKCDERVRKAPPLRFMNNSFVFGISNTETFALRQAAKICNKFFGEKLPDEVVKLANDVSNKIWVEIEMANNVPKAHEYTMNDIK